MQNAKSSSRSIGDATLVGLQDVRFIDLFAGIGGLRQAFEREGARCVFTSEWDAYAQKTYSANFGVPVDEIWGDITQVDPDAVPAHDVLLAGFPCQPFSIAGVSKKNALGRAHGFSDLTQGTLFFDICKILDAKKPSAFLLENVKNLKSHDKGRTFSVILHALDELGYDVFHKVIDGAHFTAQHRERILLAGFKKSAHAKFNWDAVPLPPKGLHTMREVLHRTDGTEPYLPWDGERFFNHHASLVQTKFTLSDKLWAYLQNYAAKHRASGNGFGFGLTHADGTSRTLSARYYKDGSEILIRQNAPLNPRRLTPRECARLMGFPDTFQIPVSDTRAYKQFGNSVVIDVMQHAAMLLMPFLRRNERVASASREANESSEIVDAVAAV